TQYNHVSTAIGYASSTAAPAHFGLGDDDAATLIEITWPSGAIQTLKDVPADQILPVTEPPT
ncbi:MAG: CRTAC1 family protein, partial [bacterium]|nr:CRTAC1 family protein [bacterium]